ncbi:MAG: PD-(D/E)XK nuclease family protein [Deltaproteobacteria bacterium]|nr:PD-(D/E)XK nuclease family protein [Deltaproteobacteria bacterium]
MAAGIKMNKVLESLDAVLAEYPWQAKYVVFPSPRQADTALRALARMTRGWVNAHGTSVSRLALMLAEPALSSKGCTALSPVMFEDLVERAWTSIDDRKEKGVALSLGPRTPGAVSALARTITDLRIGGVTPGDLGKGALRDVYDEYMRLLAESRAADRALVFETALKGSLTRGTKLVLAGGLYDTLTGLERGLVDHLLKHGSERLDLDREKISLAGEEPGPPAPRLAWIGAAHIADAAKRAGPEVEVFEAASPFCEVREIFRRLLKPERSRTPFEDVEVALMDEETYVPLVYEVGGQFAKDPLDLVSFEHGIHARHTRPARCLRKFVEWVGSDFDAAVLHSLLSSGDLPVEAIAGDGGPFAYRLARVLRNIGAFRGLSQGRERIAREVEAAAQEAAGTAGAGAEGDPPRAGARSRSDNAQALATLFARLTSGLDSVSAATLGRACLQVLSLFRPVSNLEGAAVRALRSEIEALCEIETKTEAAALVARFADAMDSVRVSQSHPSPGRIHVTNLASAGLDARPLTFVPGMDDGRYPGTFLQDPFMRDHLRKRLNLRTRRSAFDERGIEARAALARLRGCVVVSWPGGDPAAGAECFPSRVALDCYRLGGGAPDASYSDIGTARGGAWPSYLPESAALSPADEVVLGVFAESRKRIRLARGEPRIARGLDALAARAGAGFTEFDGDIGPYRDPCADPDYVLSASRIQTLARCPMRYLFGNVLGIRPEGDLEFSPLEWLDQLGHGELLHMAFQRYGAEVIAGKTSDAKKTGRRVAREYAERHPPPSQMAFEIEMARVDEAMDVFARTWARLSKEWKPVELEMEFGMSTRGARFPVPVKVPAGGGRFLMLRGRIDRVDVRREGRGAAVWDYKTGAFRDPGKNFGAGSLLQPFLYACAVEALLGQGVSAGGFLYTGRDGQPVEAEVDLGPEGRKVAEEILSCVCATTAAGHFPPTGGDCTYCDYKAACVPGRSAAIEKVRGSAFSGMGAMIFGKKFDET